MTVQYRVRLPWRRPSVDGERTLLFMVAFRQRRKAEKRTNRRQRDGERARPSGLRRRENRLEPGAVFSAFLRCRNTSHFPPLLMPPTVQELARLLFLNIHLLCSGT